MASRLLKASHLVWIALVVQLASCLQFAHVDEPGAVDAPSGVNFLRSIANAPGDVLALLYAPGCPDCEWLTKKVWQSVTQKLAGDPSISVMILSDPGFAAPKPFEHWHNPAIFWVAKNGKMDPIFFPQARLQEYLAGGPSRPQDQQDSDFIEDLLVFAKGAVGARLFSEKVPVPVSEYKALGDVYSLAGNGWKVLQGKWATSRNPPAWIKSPSASYPGPPTASLMASAQTVQSFDANAMQPQMPLQMSMANADATMQMLGQMPELPMQMPGQMPLQMPEQVPMQMPMQMPMQIPGQMPAQMAAPLPPGPPQQAMAYAQQFVQTHSGQGYTVTGVYDYALPYYQKHEGQR